MIGVSIMFKHIFPITKPFKRHDSTVSANGEYGEINVELLYKFGNRYFVLIKNSGYFLEIDDRAYNYLFNKTDDVEVRREWEILKQVGAFEKQNYYDYDNNYEIKSININISETCNLSCRYCFAQEGEYGKINKRMTSERLKSIIDKATRCIGPNKKLNIVLFGGEPLLRRDLVIEAIQYADFIKKRMNIDIIVDIFTNGTLIDQEIINMIKDNSNVRILLSLDGTPNVNNHNRKMKNGELLSEIIENKIDLFQSLPYDRIVVRATITDNTADLVTKSKYFLSLGFRNIVYDVAYCINHPNIPDSNILLDGIKRELHQLANYMITRIKNHEYCSINLISEQMSQILMNNPEATSTYVEACPAGRHYLAIDTNGDIYPCHFFVGIPNYQIGTIDADGIVQTNMSYQNGTLDLRKNVFGNCSECSLVNICEGPCPYKQLVLYPKRKEVSNSFCDLLRNRYIEGLRVLATIYQKDKWPFIKEWCSLTEGISNEC